MAALSTLRTKGELRQYFDRKVDEGKNKMSVINAIRGKLIHRIFAEVKENRPYEKIYQNSLGWIIRVTGYYSVIEFVRTWELSKF